MGSKNDYENYRFIALMTYSSNVFLQILHQTLKTCLDQQIPDVQGGFVKGMGAWDQILNVKQITDKVREYNFSLYIYFVGYRQAFDMVKWDLVYNILSDRVPQHLTVLGRALYKYKLYI